MAKSARLKSPWRKLRTPSLLSQFLLSASGRPNSLGSRASCFRNAIIRICPKPRPASATQVQNTDDGASRRDKVRNKLAALDPAVSEIAPYLLGLLGIQEDPDPLVQMDAQIRRQRTLDAIKRVFLRESSSKKKRAKKPTSKPRGKREVEGEHTTDGVAD